MGKTIGTGTLMQLFGDIDASFFVNHEVILMVAMLPSHCLIVTEMVFEKFNFIINSIVPDIRKKDIIV